jgi:hypothetical protein
LPDRFVNGLWHGVTTNGPAKGWKSHLPFPASHSDISSGRKSAGMRTRISDISDISGEAARLRGCGGAIQLS